MDLMEKGFWKDLDKLMQFPTEGIFSTVLAISKTYNYTLMCLSSGTSIDTHTSTKAGIVQVLSGTGTFTLADEEIELKPGVFIFMPKNAPHSLKSENNLAILLGLTD
ncbi:MAG TPA: cupin domain-containing protein [Methanofastidiosum sp.]|nr:cupin domain-containing protein [Methanofastidiosum sp.]HOG74146.1 cupin domain-containing protein [Methanofastidiosum sp.]